MTTTSDLARALSRLRPGAPFSIGRAADGSPIAAFDDGAPLPAAEEIAAALAVPVEEPVPVSVSRFQARAALHLAGLLEAVEAAVAASTDPLARIAWADAQAFERTSPTIATLAAALGLSDEQLDDLFRAAAEIRA